MPGKTKAVKKKQDTDSINGDAATQTFEEAMEELEAIVEQLEQDNMTLDEALSSFEHGIGLLRTCDTYLNKVRGKITELLKGENGEFAQKILGTSLESFLSEENDHV
ncbi:MAG: exodeoxyribonuclease VII small subunit [Chitinispirillaceae bacterium]|nr:exodeoxyribonuclease VII small subunit [Chitinispirillaceae bacterium]